MLKELKPGLLMMIVMTVITGFVYPAVITVIAQAIFRDQANGSLVSFNGQVVGSRLLGQNFAKPEYFHPRPSAAGSNGYDPTATGGSNLGPTSAKLIDNVKKAIEQYRKDNPDFTGPIPADAVTTSASGIDPHISPANAEIQAARVAKARGLPIEQVQTLIAQHTEGRTLGFLGEPRVNVLELNLALDAQVSRNDRPQSPRSGSTASTDRSR
jgi:potassium-transporting ATPase KdpC subunit